MSDSLAKDLTDVFNEEGDQRFPEWFVNSFKGADNVEGVIGVIFDAYTRVPDLASPLILLLAQRLEGRGGALGILGQFINTIPPTSRALRAVTGKTTASAHADLVGHWNRFRNNPSIGALMAHAPTATAAPGTPTPAPVPAVALSRVQQSVTKALADGGFTEMEVRLVLALFRIFRVEGGMNSDAVAEVEGEANSGKLGLLDTLKENSRDLKTMFSVLEAADLEGARSCYETMRAVERSNGVTSTNRPEWRAAAAGIVRHLIPMIEFVLMGHMDRYPGSATAAAALDLWDKMNAFGLLSPSSAFLRAQSIKNTVRYTSLGLLATFGIIALYFLAVVQAASSDPDNLGWYAWLSTWVILGGAAAVTIIGAIIGAIWQKTWVALTGAFTIFAISPVVLTVAWAVAVVFSPVPDWRAWWMGLIVVVGLDFITFGLTQKVVQTVGGIPSFILGLFPNKEAATAAADKITKSNFLVSISSTIASAIVLLWLPIVFMYVLGTPVSIRIGTLAVIAAFACAHGYLKRSATMTDFTAYKSEEFAKEAKAQAVKNFKIAYGGLKSVTFGSLALYLVVFLFGVTPLLAAKDTVVHGTVRTAKIVSDGGSRMLDHAESAVGSSNDVRSAPVVAEAFKPKTPTKAEKAAAIKRYCDENPVDQSSTCKKK